MGTTLRPVGIWIVVIIVAVVVAVAVGVVLIRRRGGSDNTPTPESAPRPPRPEPAPMTGLEEALNKATDRTGHTLADRLDAQTDHVAQLRDIDDTGPLLRRALDSVDEGEESPADDAPASAGGDAADTPGTDEPDREQS